MASYNKKEFKESNVDYLNKDFSSLKGSLVNYAKSYFPNTYRDFNETSPGMMLIEMSAYVGDVMSFYIDQQYREMMLPLAEERRNVVNMAKMLGYKVKPIVPAYVDLTFTSEVNASSTDPSTVDYTDGGVWNTGIQVSSLTDSDLVFETLDIVDFTIEKADDTSNISTTTAAGLADTYTLSRTVRAVSATTTTKTFSVTAPSKFLKLTISDTNVIDIISCVDSNGNNWYEVDYLAQDQVPIPTHYTQETRTSAYYNLNDTAFVTDVPVPYSLEYIKTSKRFIRETNEDNTTSLVFGNGILKNGETIENGFLDLEQAGIVIPGQTSDLASSIDPLLGDEYSTLGETPIQTTLTVTYRKGGGITSNAATGDLTSFTSPTPLSDNSSTDASLLTVTNNIPARGGKDKEDVDEIREKSKAFFTTQNRCVTKEDYEARVMNIPAKFGNIAKVYVSRTAEYATEQQYDAQVEAINIRMTELTNFYADLPAQISALIDANLLTYIEDNQSIVNNLQDAISSLPSNLVINNNNFGTIKIHILSYDKNKNLVGNPVALLFTPSLTDNIPTILKNNVSNYIDNFRLLTDTIELLDGFIINFGVFFDVVVHKFANKSEVKLKCIQKIKDYFNINKMQFSQPIYVSQLEYELMGIDGVRAVNHVTITQHRDYNTPDGQGIPDLSPVTYKYSITDGDGYPFESDGEIDTGGTDGYGWNYNFEAALENGVILPPSPDTPGIFELKNPNQNIKGVVR